MNSPHWPRIPLSGDQCEYLRHLLFFAALMLSPLSYTIKIVYDLRVTWVDPTLVLGAAAAMLPPWSWGGVDPQLRKLAVTAFLFLGTYWLAATVAAAEWRYPDNEVYREPTRTALAALLCVACIRVVRRPSALCRTASVLGWVAVVEVVIAVYLLVGWALGLPLPSAWRAYQELYWARQSIYAGMFVWPRLGGTFIEAPPFGLYVLGALVVLRLARRSKPDREIRMPRLWMDAVLGAGVLGSLSTQVLSGAALWGIIVAASKMLAPSRDLRRRWMYGAISLVLAAILLAGAYYKYATGTRTDKEFGTSLGERRAHALLALEIVQDAPVLGIGPGQFGQLEWRRSFDLYDKRVSPQSFFHELLADTGMMWLGTALLFIGTLLGIMLRQRKYWCVGAAAGMLVADTFQANWRWPIVAIALGSLIATCAAGTDQIQGQRAS